MVGQFIFSMLAWSLEEERADKVMKGIAGSVIAIGLLTIFMRWAYLGEYYSDVMSSKDTLPGPSRHEVELTLSKVHAESPEIFRAREVVTTHFGVEISPW